MRAGCRAATAVACLLAAAPAAAQYVNFESSHVHPIALTPSRASLLAVNTPGATLEVFTVGSQGGLTRRASIPVGLEPVSVAARNDAEAWVVNHLSDSISIVDLEQGTVVRTLAAGDEPTDVAFARGKAFVTVSREDVVKVFDLANLASAPQSIPLFGSNPRALAVSPDGGKVYAVVLNSGNRTTVVNANIIRDNESGLDPARLAALGLNDMTCSSPPPPYPPLPAGIQRNPALTDPAPPAQPPVSLIVGWDEASQQWRDEAGQDWTPCLPFRLPDHDLFVIDANAPAAPMLVDHLGTTLFEVSVNPASGRVYVPHTEARNLARFEHELGVRGHVVDNRMAVVDPAAGNAVTLIDLNAHIDRGSDPSSNLAERLASISQPGMMVWNAAGTRAWLTAIGSRKLFRLDGTCLAGSCIFGPSRAAPDAVVTGEGPTGVALHEPADRLYVLNRFSNTIALVEASTMTLAGTVPMHDPSPAVVRDGRRLLYDGIDSSRHGDAACSSCHISGNMDKLAWDLGDPEGGFAPYGTPGDNVRFIIPFGGQAVECSASVCAAHEGFDPQKGPMTTQTLRGMLEPLHWRGDRGTMNDFNPAFVGLMGKPDIGPINGKPAGLDAASMELFRQFALGIRFPPNPFRNVNDTLLNGEVSVPGQQHPGNPAAGQTVFFTGAVDAGQPCSACHTLPFGAAGGKLGGVSPGDPSAARAALFNGDADGSPHSDLKVPHLRNMYEKFGPLFDAPGASPPAGRKNGFGFIHDGSIPDLATFLSASVFNMTAQQVRDVAMFMLHFPTGTRPSVGRHVTVPPGPAPTSTPVEEALLSALIALGNAADPSRHCELTAASVSSGPGARSRTWQLDGGSGSGGLWTTDVDGEPQVATADLRQGAGGPITFLCATIGSGRRLGADRDLDGRLNGSDCSDGDPSFFSAPAEVANLLVGAPSSTELTWDGQQASIGPSLFYEVAGGSLSGLGGAGPAGSGECLTGALSTAGWQDPRPDPPAGDGYWYLVRARTPECSGGFGPPVAALEALDCTAH
ncbi:MAG TPA: YncE family protein [Candidatus Polarisedimenticolia bacterium]|nr:YncE family protein [Candidatus Polarisedimenticolia bacterium]